MSASGKGKITSFFTKASSPTAVFDDLQKPVAPKCLQLPTIKSTKSLLSTALGEDALDFAHRKGMCEIVGDVNGL